MSKQEMPEDLEWLARNVSEWPMEPVSGSHSIGWNGMNKENQPPDFIRRADPCSDEYTYAQWLQARRQLGLVTTEEEDEAFEAMQEIDMVNHPPHYQSDNGIECIDAIRAALGRDGFIAYCRGNVIKYSWRLKSSPAEDQGKAAWYANKAREALEE